MQPRRRNLVQTTLDELWSAPQQPRPASLALYRNHDAGHACELDVVILNEHIGELHPSDWALKSCRCRRECNAACVNRRRLIECSALTCNLQGNCSNRRWRTRTAELEIRKAGDKGLGVFALHNVSRGSLLCEYVGEIIDAVEKERHYGTTGALYLRQYGLESYIDAQHTGNISRFINHSCKPNSRAEEWSVYGVFRVGIFAIRNINAGEEIAFDYGPEYNINNCLCESCLE